MVRIPSGTPHAVVAGPALHAVDVVADDSLQVLDLSQCAPGMHLTLLGDARPERIMVPPMGAGAVLHLSLPNLTNPVEVEGAVQVLDLAWTNAAGKTRTAALDIHDTRSIQSLDEDFHVLPWNRREPLQAAAPANGAWIGAGDHRPASSAGLIVMSDATLDAAWLTEAAAASHVLIQHSSAPDGLRSDAWIVALRLRNVRIPSIDVAQMGLLRLDGVDDIVRIGRRAQRIVVRDSTGGPSVSIDGIVLEADISSLSCRLLRIPHVQTIHLQGVDGIETVETLAHSDDITITASGQGHVPRFEGVNPVLLRSQPATPADIEAAFVHGTPEERAAMIYWAQLCKKQSDLWLALQVFSSAIDTGSSAAQMWESRCRLAGKTARSQWKWDFPDDLAVRGWTADLRLWLRAVAAEVPEAIAYARVLRGASEPPHIAVFLLAAASPDLSEPERSLFFDLAEQALVAGAQGGRRLDIHKQKGGGERVGTVPALVLTWLYQALRSLLDQAHNPGAFQIAAAYSAWLAVRVPNSDGARLLGVLSSHGCPAATDKLLELRADLPKRNELDRLARDQLSRTISQQLLLGTQPPLFVIPAPAAQESLS